MTYSYSVYSVAVSGRLVDSLSETNQDKKPSRTLLQLPQSQAEYMSLKLLTKSLAPDKDVFVLLTLSSDRCFKDNTQNVNHTLKLEGFRQLFFSGLG